MSTEIAGITPASTRAVYQERAYLVALLSCHYQAFLTTDPLPLRADCSTVVIVYLPTGQLSWHIHDDDRGLFAHVPEGDPGMWDGHSTHLKYARVFTEIGRLAPPQTSCSHVGGEVA